MDERFIVQGLAGEKCLHGDLPVAGAKNAITKILPAAILFEDELVVENVPTIEDALRMGELLQAAGATLERRGDCLRIGQPREWNSVLDKKLAERLRASIVFTGPLLARTGRAEFPFPGGCVLGERSINLFLNGFRAMGATVEEVDSYFTLSAQGGLRGAHITFPLVSVTGTETLMMAGVLAEGETVLENAALEPEIGYLAEFLNSCGARISGIGTSTLHIHGGVPLRAAGKPFVVPFDRIEAGSFILLAALAGKDVTITHCDPAWLSIPLSLFKKARVPLEVGTDFVRVQGAARAEPYSMFSVRTHEYPGFPTDLQAPTATFLSQCEGEGSILETIFDGRFRYVDDLVLMGADITVMNPHRILIRGPKKLSRKQLRSPDLRGGLAYLMAATVAEGASTIDDAYIIDRGYERIEERLQAIGLDITRQKV